MGGGADIMIQDQDGDGQFQLQHAYASYVSQDRTSVRSSSASERTVCWKRHAYRAVGFQKGRGSESSDESADLSHEDTDSETGEEEDPDKTDSDTNLRKKMTAK